MKLPSRKRRRGMLVFLVVAPAVCVILAGFSQVAAYRIRSKWLPKQVFNAEGVLAGAEARLYPGGSTGCLLIHGFPGNPAEMIELGEFLAARSLTVRVMRLPGFGTTPFDLRTKSREDWCRAARDELAKLREVCERVFVVGFSTGGLIALHLAAEEDVAGVVGLSVFVFPRNKLAYVGKAPILKEFLPWLLHYTPSMPALGVDSAEAAGGNPLCYPYVPLRSAVQVLELADVVKGELGRIDEQVLLIQSEGDRTVDPRSAQYLLQALGSERKKLHRLERSGHVITCGPEQERVFEEVLGFVSAGRGT